MVASKTFFVPPLNNPFGDTDIGKARYEMLYRNSVFIIYYVRYAAKVLIVTVGQTVLVYLYL